MKDPKLSQGLSFPMPEIIIVLISMMMMMMMMKITMFLISPPPTRSQYPSLLSTPNTTPNKHHYHHHRHHHRHHCRHHHHHHHHHHQHQNSTVYRLTMNSILYASKTLLFRIMRKIFFILTKINSLERHEDRSQTRNQAQNF